MSDGRERSTQLSSFLQLSWLWDSPWTHDGKRRAVKTPRIYTLPFCGKAAERKAFGRLRKETTNKTRVMSRTDELDMWIGEYESAAARAVTGSRRELNCVNKFCDWERGVFVLTCEWAALLALHGTGAAHPAARNNSGRQLSPHFPSKQTKAAGGGESAEPGSGPQPGRRASRPAVYVCVWWRGDSTPLVFAPTGSSANCCRAVAAWRGALPPPATDPGPSPPEPSSGRFARSTLWGNTLSSRLEVWYGDIVTCQRHAREDISATWRHALSDVLPRTIINSWATKSLLKLFCCSPIFALHYEQRFNFK